MVKRPKSPEPIEESKFLAVVYPYPLNANMELIGDFTNFMYWLASVVGKDYALGVFFKPSARGMIVAEVSKTFTQFEKLLGEHRWSEFLREPAAEEKDKKSKVYYCTYTNSRALQKDGWKYLLAEDELFSQFRPVNKKVKHPYPPPHWCEPHYEDPTTKPVCRPLPSLTKALPSRTPPANQVPGSSTWINKKSGISGTADGLPHGSKGGSQFKGESKAGGSKNKSKATINPDAWKTPITPAATKSTPRPPSPSNIPPKAAWAKSSSLASVPRDMPAPQPVSPASAVAVTELDSMSSVSQLAPVPYESFDDFSESESFGPLGLPPLIPKGKPTNPVGSSSIPTLQRQFASSSISSDANSIAATASQSGYLDDYDDDSDEDPFEFPTSDIISVRDGITYDPGSAPRMGKGPGKGRRGQGNVIAESSFTSSSKNQKDSSSKVIQQYSTRTFRKIIEEEPCPVHGVICSKGICSVMKKRRWEKEREEKKKEREGRKKSGKGLPEHDEKGNVVNDPETQQEDDSSADGEGEVEDSTESAVKSDPSVARTQSSATESKEPESRGKGRKGDWGPKKERKAKQKPFLFGRTSEAPASSKASSSTNNSSLYGTYAPSSHRSTSVSESASVPSIVGSVATSSRLTVKSTSIPPSSVWRAPSTSPSSFRGANLSQGTGSNPPVMMRKGGSALSDTRPSTGVSVGANAENGKRKESWRPPFEPVVPEIKVRPGEQVKKVKPKTWDEMVEDGDTELGSIMDFSGQ